jgi:transposase
MARSPGRDVGQADWLGKDVLPEAARVRDGGDGPGRQADALGAIDRRTKESVDAHFSAQPAHRRESVEVVAMDMWRPYMDAAARWLPNAALCFDRFHVARHLGEAVNRVRMAEHRRLRTEGDRTLVRTK